MGSAGQCRGDGDDPRAGGEVEDPAPRDDVGVVEHVAREGLPTRPREGPERRRLLVGPRPGAVDVVGEQERDLADQRRSAGGRPAGDLFLQVSTIRRALLTRRHEVSPDGRSARADPDLPCSATE
jgi:hypothetical protein